MKRMSGSAPSCGHKGWNLGKGDKKGTLINSKTCWPQPPENHHGRSSRSARIKMQQASETRMNSEWQPSGFIGIEPHFLALALFHKYLGQYVTIYNRGHSAMLNPLGFFSHFCLGPFGLRHQRDCFSSTPTPQVLHRTGPVPE